MEKKVNGKMIMNNNLLKLLIVFLIIIFSGVLTYTIIEYFTNTTEEVPSILGEANNVEHEIISSDNEPSENRKYTYKSGLLSSTESSAGSILSITNSLFLFIIVLVMLYLLLRKSSAKCNNITKHIEDSSSIVNNYYNGETNASSKLLTAFNNSHIDIIDNIIQSSEKGFESLETYKKLLNAYTVIMSNDETYKSKENAAYYINKHNKYVSKELINSLLSDGIISRSLYSIIETGDLDQT